MTKTAMRVAHLSDLHVLDLTGVSPLRFFNKRLIGGLNLLRKRARRHPLQILDALARDLNQETLDHIVVTGDLSNLSLPAEFLRARQFLEELRLEASAITVIPGNHDCYVLEAYWARHFERILEDYCASDDKSVRFPLVRVRGPVAFIGCSTARPSPPPLADGWLGQKQIADIATALRELRGHFRVLLIHHPPLPQRLDILRGLRDRRALHQVILQFGCELILHGHEHRDLRGALPGPLGPISVLGASSSTYRDSRPERRARYNIYTISTEPFGFSTEQRVYDFDRDCFVASESNYPPESPHPR